MLKSLFTLSFKLAGLILSLSFFIFSCKEIGESSEAYFSKNISFSEKDLENLYDNIKLKSLEKEQVLDWSKNVLMIDSIDKIDYFVRDFLKIDSLKKAGKYLKYVDSLEIGMVMDSRAFFIDTLSYSKDSTLVLWALTQKSNLACPFFKRTSVFLSIFSNNMYSKTIEIAHSNYMGDPPNFYSSISESKIKNNSIIISRTLIQAEDYDKTDTSRTQINRRF
jgi:hypothetical protein